MKNLQIILTRRDEANGFCKLLCSLTEAWFRFFPTGGPPKGRTPMFFGPTRGPPLGIPPPKVAREAPRNPERITYRSHPFRGWL